MGLFDFFKRKAAPQPSYGVLCQFSVPSMYAVCDANKDGSSRQALINAAAQGDDLYIKAAPTDVYPLSYGVFNKKGKQLGVLPPKFVKMLMTEYAGRNLSAVVEKIKPGRAVNIEMLVTVYDNPPTARGYTAAEWDKIVLDNEVVYVAAKGGRVYHSVCNCGNGDCVAMIIKKARASGFTPCKKCYKV